MKVNMFTSRHWRFGLIGMRNACRSGRILSACFNSKYARDPWRRSLTSLTGAEANDARFHRQSVHNEKSCEGAAVGCAELQTKGSLFSFHTFPKIAVKGSFILGYSNWKFFQVGYRVDTHTDMNFLLRASVTHRPALARLILGRWKEQSLRMKPPSLPILLKESVYPDRPKDSEIHFDTLASSAKIKIKKGAKPPSQETLQKKKGKSTKEENVHKSSARMNL